MAFQRGTVINPALGNVDYTPYLKGAQQGAETQLRGSLAATEAWAKGFNSLTGSVADALKQEHARKEQEKASLGVIQAANTMADNISAHSPSGDSGENGWITKAKQGINDTSLPMVQRLENARATMASMPGLWGHAILAKQAETQRLAVAEENRAKEKKAKLEDGVVHYMSTGQFNSGTSMEDARYIEIEGGKRLTENRTNAIQLENLVAAQSATKGSFQTLMEAEAAVNERRIKHGSGLVYEIVSHSNGSYGINVRQAEPTLQAKGVTEIQLGILKNDIDSHKNTLLVRQRASELHRLLSGSLKTGITEEWINKIRALADASGITVNKDQLVDYEYAMSLIPSFVFEYIKQSKGTTSDREMAEFKLGGPSGEKTVQANLKTLNLLNRRIQHDLDLSVNASRVYRQNESWDDIFKRRDEILGSFAETTSGGNAKDASSKVKAILVEVAETQAEDKAAAAPKPGEFKTPRVGGGASLGLDASAAARFNNLTGPGGDLGITPAPRAQQALENVPVIRIPDYAPNNLGITPAPRAMPPQTWSPFVPSQPYGR